MIPSKKQSSYETIGIAMVSCFQPLLQAIKRVAITELVFHAVIIKCTNRKRKASCFSQLHCFFVVHLLKSKLLIDVTNWNCNWLYQLYK